MAVNTYYPTEDGGISSNPLNVSWAYITSNSGSSISNTSTSTNAEVYAGASTNTFSGMKRPYFVFDTSDLDDSAIIESVTLSIKGAGYKQDELLMNDNLCVVAFNPIDINSIVYTDFDNVGSTIFSSIGYASLGNFTYNVFTFNASGIASISKTGKTAFSLRWQDDVTGTFGGTWSASKTTKAYFYTSEQAGTGSDPVLTVTYTIPSASISPSSSVSRSVSPSSSISKSASPSSSTSPSSSSSLSTSPSSSISSSPSASPAPEGIEINASSFLNDPNLVAYYRMENGALTTDTTGHGHTLTNNGTITAEASGKFGYCADLGTANSTKAFTRATGLGIDMSGAFSVIIWIKMRTELATNTLAEIMRWESSTGTARYLSLYYQDISGNKRLVANNSEGYATFNDGANSTLGTTNWHMIVVTASGTTVRLYLDGSQVATATRGTATLGNQLNIGGLSGQYTSAYIDDIPFFNDELTASEIQRIWQGTASPSPSSSLSNSPSLSASPSSSVSSSASLSVSPSSSISKSPSPSSSISSSSSKSQSPSASFSPSSSVSPSPSVSSSPSESIGLYEKFDTLTKDFNDNLIDDRFGVSIGGTVDVDIVNERLEIELPVAGGSGQYGVLYTNNPYDLTNSYVTVQLKQAPRTDTGAQAIFRLHRPSSGGLINAVIENGNVNVTYYDTSLDATALGGFAYDRQIHRFFRYRGDDTKIYFDWSTDLITWTNVYEVDPEWGLTALYLNLTGETYQAEVNAGTVIWDNINSETTETVMLPNRRGRIDFGFVVPDGANYVSQYLQSFNGSTEYPDISLESATASFHLFDELEYLSTSKLSGGSLKQDIKTDTYIWGILDYVYDGHYTTIASCDSTESWSDVTGDSTNARVGDEAIRIDAVSGGTTDSVLALSSLDISGYQAEDYITFFLNVESITKLDTVTIYFGDTGLTNYYSHTLQGSDLVNGWQQVYIERNDFTATGSPSWADLDELQISVTANTAEDVYVIIDEIRIIDRNNYPIRYFDVGLQIIPVAWWGGNTALYEIQVASEAEGARFYADENGVLRFENRQYFNLNPDSKVSVAGFDFNNLVDLSYIGTDSEIINNVVVKLKLRKVASTQEIWSYPYIPKAIGAGVTITVWAEFQDPVPTTLTGLITPVANTDYTANANSDGSGADRTSDISISITKFSTASILEIENTSGTTLYLTSLKIRGTPALESDEVRITSEDATSISKYGEQPNGGYVIENKYLADEAYAQTLADQIVDWYKNPLHRVILKNRSIPQLQLGDMISVHNEYQDESRLMRITRLKLSLDENGFNQEIHARGLGNFETLTFFEIGTSAIESTDVIAT